VTDPYLRPAKILHSFSRLYPDAWKQGIQTPANSPIFLRPFTHPSSRSFRVFLNSLDLRCFCGCLDSLDLRCFCGCLDSLRNIPKDEATR
jgi:hypothetical protein